jgi:hypothetical protein
MSEHSHDITPAPPKTERWIFSWRAKTAALMPLDDVAHSRQRAAFAKPRIPLA